MGFAVGDRVVVTEKYRGAGCNHGAIGYYGHVIRLSRAERDPLGPMVHVAIQGRINGPAEDYYLSFGTPTNGFPLYEFEIEHARTDRTVIGLGGMMDRLSELGTWRGHKQRDVERARSDLARAEADFAAADLAYQLYITAPLDCCGHSESCHGDGSGKGCYICGCLS